MKITSVLLKPNLAEVENGFLRLMVLLRGQNFEEARGLRSYIEKQLREIHKTGSVLFSWENNSSNGLPCELFEDFREMKLRLRFAERRWKLILSNQARSQKMRERTGHVASVAA